MSHPALLLSGRRILVVEDEYLIATEVKRWLRESGAGVVGPVPSADRALDLIEDHSLDAAVLDINLGHGATSYPVADRSELLGVPYLFASGEAARQVGAGDYNAPPLLEKPCSKGDLVRELGDLIAC